MTILDITNKLFEFFQTNDMFSIENDFKSIVPIYDNLAEEQTLVRLGLEKLVEAKLLSKSIVFKDVDGKIVKNVWFLEKPLNQFEQNITISGPTATAISSIINEVSKEQASNSLNITEKDIQGLIYVINGLLKANQEQKEGDKY